MRYLRNASSGPVIAWLYSGILLLFLMIAVGGITRLTESGLSITEWNVVMGSLPPMDQAAWDSEFEKYRQSPEFRLKNFDFTLEDFKAIYWWEWIHRLLGRLIGLVFLLPFLYFLFKKRFKGKMIRRLLFIFILGGFQGFIGWYMVQSGLVNEPRVSHFRLALHLMTALLTISLIWWLIMDIRFEGTQPSINKYPDYFRKVVIFIALLALQITYGAFVAGLDAGQNFNTWPKMGDEWIPRAVYAEPSIWDNLFRNPWGIQFVHRTLAVVLAIYTILLWLASRKMTLRPYQRAGANYMMGAVILQFALGVFTILYHVPIWLGVLHQFGAVLLLLSSLYFLHRLRANI